jgi:hypothetical protein
MATKHMQRWQPTAYASIPTQERESYFLELNEAVAEAIRRREASLMPSASLAHDNHQEFVAQMNMSHLMAEDAVLAEMVLLPPEPGLASWGDEPETDSTGAYLDQGWRSPRLELSQEEWQDRQAEMAWRPAAAPRPPQEQTAEQPAS